MEYNTIRTQMLMPEYGRNEQGMAQYLLTIEDPAQRLRNAEAIIDIMAILNPQLKQIEDYRHKLWDHLYQMTDFKLQVDSPYQPPTAEEIRRKPKVIPYPANKIRFRHLGHNLEQVLNKAVEETDLKKNRALRQHIAYYMKLAYANWHKEPVQDDLVRTELAQDQPGRARVRSRRTASTWWIPARTWEWDRDPISTRKISPGVVRTGISFRQVTPEQVSKTGSSTTKTNLKAEA